MLSFLGIDRVLTTAAEAGADALAAKERVILHVFIVASWTVFRGHPLLITAGRFRGLFRCARPLALGCFANVFNVGKVAGTS